VYNSKELHLLENEVKRMVGQEIRQPKKNSHEAELV